jgi:DsbC/DsbD-like thiol-disulfide interchange protein
MDTNRCRLAFPLALLACAALPVRPAFAQAAAASQVAAPSFVAPPNRHVTVSLVSETDAVVPGRPLTLGIRLQMQPGWHTYWRNPGDSGLPTRVRWTLPTGFEAGGLLWPRPLRFAAGPLQSFGYEREVVLPVELKVPATIGGSEVRLGARVDWLECQEACLPGKAELSLALPVRARAAPGPQAALIAEARKQLPAADPAWRFAATAAGDALRLAVKPPRGTAVSEAWFYPLVPRVLDHAKPQALAKDPAGFSLALTRDTGGTPPERLQGVLVARTATGERALEVDVPLASAAAAR